MRFDNASHVEDVVWIMRLADLPRGQNRVILNQLYNGDPPYNPALAEENNVEVNRNDLTGPNLLSQARRQWNQAFLSPPNFFTVTLDSGPPSKRREWGNIITKHVNRVLKEDLRQLDEKRSTGGNVMLHGIGPVTWDDRRGVIGTPLDIASVLVPSETRISFDNLAYFATFREWTPAQLYSKTHGLRVDPGWDMELVDSQIKYVVEQVTKRPNATAYQYMPERIEELIKQDMGFWGSDAVPTIDVWDFFFREVEEDGKGWYRRTILDWGVAEGLTKDSPKPDHQNPMADGRFLYSSGKRRYANSLGEILHCQFADCSAVFPQRYHSVRSLGWMLWGTCDLQNRLHCKFQEAVMQQMMWYFQSASDNDFRRLKRADFMHFGVIPPGISWIKAGDRYAPPLPIVEYAFNRNRSLMNDAAAAYTQDFTRQGGGKEMTATETMAIVNSMNALVSGMLALAYNYEDAKHREQCRRITIRNNPDPIAKKIITACLLDGVPSLYLDAKRWQVQSDRVLGGGNKTLGLAQANFLLGIRKNLGPDAQRKIDHIAISENIDNPGLAEELAPVADQNKVSRSMHDAQAITDRLMRNLPYAPQPEMIYEDYVKVWIADLSLMVANALQTNLATPEDVLGFANVAKHVKMFLAIIASNDDEIPKVKDYGQQLSDQLNLVRKIAKNVAEREMAKQQNGNGGIDPVKLAQIQIDQMQAEQKAQQREQSHAQKSQEKAQSHAEKTAQQQVAFDLEEARKDRETNAEIRRQNAMAAHEAGRKQLAETATEE